MCSSDRVQGESMARRFFSSFRVTHSTDGPRCSSRCLSLGACASVRGEGPRMAPDCDRGRMTTHRTTPSKACVRTRTCLGSRKPHHPHFGGCEGVAKGLHTYFLPAWRSPEALKLSR